MYRPTNEEILEREAKIMKLFWFSNWIGPKPYDNSDSTIAKKVGSSAYIVARVIKLNLRKKYRNWPEKQIP